MAWLGLKFNSIHMTVTLQPDKLDEVMGLVHNWLHKEVPNIHDLRTIMGKVLYVANVALLPNCFPTECLTPSGGAHSKVLYNLSS